MNKNENEIITKTSEILEIWRRYYTKQLSNRRILEEHTCRKREWRRRKKWLHGKRNDSRRLAKEFNLSIYKKVSIQNARITVICLLIVTYEVYTWIIEKRESTS